MNKIILLIIVAMFLASPCFGGEWTNLDGTKTQMPEPKQVGLRCPYCGFEGQTPETSFSSVNSDFFVGSYNPDEWKIKCQNCGKESLAKYMVQVYVEKQRKDQNERISAIKGSNVR